MTQVCEQEDDGELDPSVIRVMQTTLGQFPACDPTGDAWHAPSVGFLEKRDKQDKKESKRRIIDCQKDY